MKQRTILHVSLVLGSLVTVGAVESSAQSSICGEWDVVSAPVPITGDYGSSEFRDVEAIATDDVWAVGEIHTGSPEWGHQNPGNALGRCGVDHRADSESEPDDQLTRMHLSGVERRRLGRGPEGNLHSVPCAVPQIIRNVTEVVDGFSPQAKSEFLAVIDQAPMAFQKTNAIFATPEKKTPGAGGVFSIFGRA